MTIRFRIGPEKVICACIRVIRRDSQYYSTAPRVARPTDVRASHSTRRARAASPTSVVFVGGSTRRTTAPSPASFCRVVRPSIEMPQSLHAGGSVRDQTRQNQRGRRAQIRPSNVRRAKRSPRPANHHLAFVRAPPRVASHLRELFDVQKSVLEDSPRIGRRPLRRRRQHAQLGLHVRGHPGVRSRGEVHGGESAAPPAGG